MRKFLFQKNRTFPLGFLSDHILVKIFFYGLLFIKILFPTISHADAEVLFKENSKAVVVVMAYDFAHDPIAQGSGFVVRQDGVIVTNYHVINKATYIAIKVRGKVLEVEGLLYIDRENDLVIIKAKANDLPVVRLGDVDEMNIGEKVYVISSPKGYENTISEGILSGIRVADHKGKILQITAPISKGSSGAPVFNKNGDVVGVVTFLIKEAQNLNFAMPVNLLRDKMDSKETISLKEYKEEFEKEYIKWLAATLVKTQDWSRAKIPKGKTIEVSEEVLRLNPYHANAHTTLIVHYYCNGYKEKALEQYQILKAFNPSAAYGIRCLFGDSFFK